MSNIIKFADVWRKKGQKLEIRADDAWRFINILKSEDFQELAVALHYRSPLTSYFMLKVPLGKTSHQEMRKIVEYSDSTFNACLSLAHSLRMIKVHRNRETHEKEISLSPYGFFIQRALKNGLFKKAV